MGGKQYSDERPIHEVNVAGFWMMRYPVTNAQYRQFVEADGYERSGGGQMPDGKRVKRMIGRNRATGMTRSGTVHGSRWLA